ncbi:MAG: hypothetical protein E7598_00795 [Ruminococcaceae bacterium]|nr:hypothetical protein [Oscillospiraceae bacterium]
MKKLLLLICFVLSAVILFGCGEKTDMPEENALIELDNNVKLSSFTYQNKITGSAADPFILKDGGAYYLYSTGGSRFTVRKSFDLINWETQEEPILRLSDTTWATQKGWAPEMYEYNGKFYMIFSAANAKGIHSIEIAVCDTPYGKFKPLYDQPFFSPGYSVIDGSLFFDDDGRIYMYYSKDNSTNIVNGKRTSQTWGVELYPDFSGIIGEPVLISTPYQDWELKSGSVLWNEGPVVFKENGVYYLLYSANYFVSEHYSVGYATSDSPLKMFEKNDKACILSGNGVSVTGPGHCNILRSPDGSEIYVVYHVHTVPPNTDKGRSLAIDRLIINEDGTLAIDGPSEIRRPLPSGVIGYKRVTEGFTYAGNGEKAEFSYNSALDNVFDGVIQRGITGIYSMASGGNVEVRFDVPTKLTAALIYSSTYDDYVPGRIDVEINGKYVVNDCGLIQYGGRIAAVNLEALPDGEAVESIKVTVTAANGSEYAALSEIVFIGR